ncbi:MAG: DUF1127 domain-containing protein [Rhodobacteraceae bacterium]|jgi:uncharacterized protein YjiS (DUF1127 family)|nr:DUF1127 domain-containing protein [Paracoccaceae bacterium]
MHTLGFASVPAVRQAGAWRAPLAWLSLLLAVRHERARLADLDDHTLADIGVSRAAAAREAARPLWDVPANR